MDCRKTSNPSFNGFGANWQQEVIAEAERMIPDAQRRLEAGLTDLKALLVRCCADIRINPQEAMDNEVSREKKSEAETVIQEGETAVQE